MTRKPFRSQFLFIFTAIHLNPLITQSRNTTGEIATQPIIKKIFSTIMIIYPAAHCLLAHRYQLGL